MDNSANDHLEKWVRETVTWSDYPPQILQCYADWLRNASPEDWHRAAESWNWTYESGPMRWIICQSDCDPATAVLIYYLAGPSYHRDFGPDKVPPLAQEGFDLVSAIRERIAAGAYTRSAIAFDPRREFATEMRLAPISHDPLFPTVFSGQTVERPADWDDGFPPQVWEAARSG